MKPWPKHHKRVRVPFAVVAKGYGGVRVGLPGLPGLWQIIAADTEPTPGYAQWPAFHGTIMLIVAPARARDDK